MRIPGAHPLPGVVRSCLLQLSRSLAVDLQQSESVVRVLRFRMGGSRINGQHGTTRTRVDFGLILGLDLSDFICRHHLVGCIDGQG